MAAIRELFHALGNKHNIVTVGCGATKEIAEECLGDEDLSEGLKNNLLEIRKNIQEIIKEAIEADKIAVEIHNRVYAMIDPDTGKPK